MSAGSFDEKVWKDRGSTESDYRRLLTSGPLTIPGLLMLLALAGFAMGTLMMSQSGFRKPEPTATPTPTPTPVPPDPASFIAPYSVYWITQGPHGHTYGPLGIDFAAGEGEPILSPIFGQVTRRDIDRFGNSVLIIENEIYRVTLLHGFYNVNVGDLLNQGDTVGEEGNLGYTTDMQGRKCAARFCGYHTHMNVYDKRVGANVNPLDLLP